MVETKLNKIHYPKVHDNVILKIKLRIFHKRIYFIDPESLYFIESLSGFKGEQRLRSHGGWHNTTTKHFSESSSKLKYQGQILSPVHS